MPRGRRSRTAGLIERIVSACRRRPDRAAALVLALLPFAIFAPAFLPGRVLSPLGNLYGAYPWSSLGAGLAAAANPALTDITQVFHPALLYAAREVGEGRFPVWNPYAYAGVPFFSNPQTALLFPLTALAFVLPAGLALTLMSALKLSAAGLATYWFLRTSLGVSPLPALTGALGFMLSSTLVTWLPWTFGSTMLFIPLLFGVIDRLRATGRRRWVAALAVVVALDVLAGYPQGAFHALLAAGAWALARAPGGGARFLMQAAAGGALGVALSAVQLVPFADYARESTVFAYRSAWTPRLSVPPGALITFLLPEFYGVGAESWGRWQFNIQSTYVGLVPVLALPAALAAAWRTAAVRFFAGLGAVVAAVHYGMPGVTALAATPGMSLGTNLRLMPLLAFAVCVLGAAGLEAVARAAPAQRAMLTRLVRGWAVALVVAALACVLAWGTEAGARALTYSLSMQYVVFAVLGAAAALALLAALAAPARRAPLAVLAAVQLASLLPLAVTYHSAFDTRWLYPTTPALAWLQSHAGTARVLLPGHVGLLYGLFEAHGYDGLTPRRIEEVVGAVGARNAVVQGFLDNPVAMHGSEPLSPVTALLSPARDLVGLRYVVLPAGAAPPWPELRPVYDGADARIFANDRALPRAFVATRARCVDDAAAVRLIRARAVDLATEVLLADCHAAPVAARPGAVARAEIRAYGPRRVAVSAVSDGPAHLVLTDTWYPGWSVRVDGRAAPLLRADHAFRAVALEAGAHEVEFVFWPRGFWLGLAVSGAAAAVVAGLVIPRSRRALVLALVASALVAAGAGRADAELAAGPFRLVVSPPTPPGGPAEIGLEPRGAHTGAWDAYVMWATGERAAFLSPEGAWVPARTPFRTAVAAGARVVAPWPRPGPAGEIPLALVLVRPGDDPLDRGQWAFRPELATVTVGAPAPPAWRRAWSEWAPVAAVAAITCALVLLFRPRPADGGPSSPHASLV
ncbi:MAG: YfhO family protein [Candidatus Rokuibacteriota bacterium]